MPEEIIGIDHIFITVSDLAKSEEFYDRLFNVVGFRKELSAIDGEPHVHYYNRHFGYWLRPGRRAEPRHDPYSPGLHHLCFRVPDEAAVDRAASALSETGIESSEPRYYPEYSNDYYASFFSDPDGIRLEIRSFGAWRKHQLNDWQSVGSD